MWGWNEIRNSASTRQHCDSHEECNSIHDTITNSCLKWLENFCQHQLNVSQGGVTRRYENIFNTFNLMSMIHPVLVAVISNLVFNMKKLAPRAVISSEEFVGLYLDSCVMKGQDIIMRKRHQLCLNYIRYCLYPIVSLCYCITLHSLQIEKFMQINDHI